MNISRNLWYVFQYIRPSVIIFLYEKFTHLKSRLHYSKAYNHKVTNKIIVCGMARSGSTLLYNYLRQGLGVNQGEYTYLRSEEDVASFILSCSQDKEVIKIHHYSPLFLKKCQEDKSNQIIFSYRDLRDVSASFVQKGWVNSLDEFLRYKLSSLVVVCSIYYASDLVRKISYQALIDFDLHQVFDSLGLTQEVNEVKDNLSAEFNVEKWIVDGVNKVNPLSGYHDNHINDPRPGKYSKLFTKKELDFLMYNSYFVHWIDITNR